MITYCTNIHAGEGWADVVAGVRANVPLVRAALARDGAGADAGADGDGDAGGPFPLSLWLSGRAARECDGREAAAFGAWCREAGCRVVSINGFPYGAFHGTPVKEQVYQPDWRDRERLAHTERLARLLAGWLADGDGPGVVSTVPLGWGDDADGGGWEEARRNVHRAAVALDRSAQATGREVVLAIEPEPGCVLETTEEVVRWFEELALPPSLRRYVGVCFDCCHQAVQFESPGESLLRLAAAEVRVAQAHVTAALRVPGGRLGELAAFDEPVYLHQAVGRRRGDGRLVRYADLPRALAAGVDGADIDEWRVHFHAPVFAERLGAVATTRPELEEALAALAPDVPLVVETYTFGVLPPALRMGTVAESIARELAWVHAAVARRAAGAGPRSEAAA